MWQPLKWGSLRSPTAGRITDLSPQLLCPEIHHCVHEESTRFRGCSQPDCDSPDPGRHETPLIGNLTHVLLIRFTKLFWELNEPHSMIFPFDFLPNLYIDFSHFFLPAVLWSFWIYGLVSVISFGKFIDIIISNISSLLFFFSFWYSNYILHMLYLCYCSIILTYFSLVIFICGGDSCLKYLFLCAF